MRPPLSAGRLSAARGGARPDDRRRGGCRSDAPPGRADRARQSGSVDERRGPAAGSHARPAVPRRARSARSEPLPVTVPVPLSQTLPLVEVTWRAVDALTFPAVPVRARSTDGTTVRRVSVARGNIALADHGRIDHASRTRFEPPLLDGTPVPAAAGAGAADHAVPAGRRLRRRFPRCASARISRATSAVRARPSPCRAARRGGQRHWWPVPTCSRAPSSRTTSWPTSTTTGARVLRFGDGEYGQRLIGVDQVDVWYRVGNGRAGNIGADSLAHIVRAGPAPRWRGRRSKQLRNPLPARRGVDPELIEQVRQYAPAAFRAKQFRAVTERDYRERRARRSPASPARSRASAGPAAGTRCSSASIPRSGDDVAHRCARRHAPRARVQAARRTTRSRATGSPATTSRSARRATCRSTSRSTSASKPGYFRGDVAHAVSLALSAGVQPDGAPGFFNPANFTFGAAGLSEPHLRGGRGGRGRRVGDASRCSTAMAAMPAGELENGVLPIGAWEIARLDNDPQQHGERHADDRRGRWVVNDGDCGCCTTPAAPVPAPIENRPGSRRSRTGSAPSPRSARRSPTSCRARRSWLRLERARQRRLHDHRHRAVVGGRRRAHVLPGADRQRGVPAHGDAARFGAAPGAADRLRAARPARRRPRGSPSRSRPARKR